MRLRRFDSHPRFNFSSFGSRSKAWNTSFTDTISPEDLEKNFFTFSIEASLDLYFISLYNTSSTILLQALFYSRDVIVGIERFSRSKSSYVLYLQMPRKKAVGLGSSQKLSAPRHRGRWLANWKPSLICLDLRRTPAPKGDAPNQTRLCAWPTNLPRRSWDWTPFRESTWGYRAQPQPHEKKPRWFLSDVSIIVRKGKSS